MLWYPENGHVSGRCPMGRDGTGSRLEVTLEEPFVLVGKMRVQGSPRQREQCAQDQEERRQCLWLKQKSVLSEGS